MENLKIYIDRLKDGQAQKIEETLAPDFLDVKEEELFFETPVQVRGEVYLADDHLVIHLDMETSATMPCSICNSAISIPIVVKNSYHTEPLKEIKSATYDVAERVRETILLQTPLFTECNGGKCPEREHLKKFLKPDEKPSDPGDIVHFPFADLK
jgi:uncharacterized metal-binding protein YceD (DUF177 family)